MVAPSACVQATVSLRRFRSPSCPPRLRHFVVPPRRQTRVESQVSGRCVLGARLIFRRPLYFPLYHPLGGWYLGSSGQPDSAVRPPASVATPASQSLDDVVPATPTPSQTSDPVLRHLLEVNTEALRKRRIGLGFSPEIQVSQPGTKHRLLNAKLNISALLEFVMCFLLYVTPRLVVSMVLWFLFR